MRTYRDKFIYYTYPFATHMIPFFLLPLIVGGLIQAIKVLIDLIVAQKFHLGLLRSAGGFPSVHSGIAASVTTLMMMLYGIHSPHFIISFSFSFLFRYDAANIRYEAGQHASSLNHISQELKDLSALIIDVDTDSAHYLTSHLKERLGHTLQEVLGGILIGALFTRLIVTYCSQFFVF